MTVLELTKFIYFEPKDLHRWLAGSKMNGMSSSNLSLFVIKLDWLARSVCLRRIPKPGPPAIVTADVGEGSLAAMYST